MATAAETVAAVAAAATVAMAVADNNRNCRGGQQSTKCGRQQQYWRRQQPWQRQSLQRGCNGRQGRQRGGSDNNESSGNSNKYPCLPLAMVRDDEREGRFVDQRW